jgi:hypothetical protein
MASGKELDWVNPPSAMGCYSASETAAKVPPVALPPIPLCCGFVDAIFCGGCCAWHSPRREWKVIKRTGNSPRTVNDAPPRIAVNRAFAQRNDRPYLCCAVEQLSCHRAISCQIVEKNLGLHKTRFRRFFEVGVLTHHGIHLRLQSIG